MQLRGRILTDDGFRTGVLRFGRRIETIDAGTGGDGAEKGGWILPGLIDLHVHGGGGGDVMDGEEGLRAACAFHASRGTTSLVATTLTAPTDALEAALVGVREVRERPAAGEARVLGAHLEGPWIHPQRLGAQPPCTREPEDWEVSRLLELGPVLVVTLAPEIPGGLELIERLVAAGVRPQIGHTTADYATVTAALERGARGFTHLFNAMSGFHHRSPGAAGAALAAAEEAELILDGHHLDPGALRMVERSIPGWYGVSDAIAAAGLPDGRHRLGGRPILKAEGVARLEDGTLAGAVEPLHGALRRLTGAGRDLAEAARRLATVPARVLGLDDRGRIAPGLRADLVVLDEDLAVRRVFLGGEEVALAEPEGAIPAADTEREAEGGTRVTVEQGREASVEAGSAASVENDPEASSRPRIHSVVETSLYVEDLERSEEFYRRLLDLEVLVSDERMRALGVGDAQVLLLFLKGATGEDSTLAGGTIPGHGGDGSLHLAFGIDAGDAGEWKRRLARAEVTLESTMTWPRGGTSLYFRDPDGHLVELITPGCWSIY